MKRLIALLALAAVAALPATATAKAKVYRGTFQLVGADGDYVSGNFGKAHLVDARRDSLSVHVRRLAKRSKYVFRLQNTCGVGEVAGWKYRRGGVLKTNRKGVANGSARSRSFRVQATKYFVGVHERKADGTLGPVVLCAELRTKFKKPSKSKPPHKPKPEEKQHGKSDAAPGHNKEEGEKRATGHGQDKGKDKPKPKGKKSRR
jgi:hypothetical protein